MTETQGQEVKKEGEEINGWVTGKHSALGSKFGKGNIA
jgi:hypothetical protein